MRIAIIIPCRDRLRSLASCLQSIDNAARHLRDTTPPEARPTLQTIVINDRSRSGFHLQVTSRFPWVDVIDSAGIGPGAARNTGIRHANADYYLFTDSDCIVDRTWLTMAAKWCRNRKTLIAQGVPWLHQLRQYPALGLNEQNLYRLLFSTYIDGDLCRQIDTRNFIIAREGIALMGEALFTTSMSEAQSESRVFARKVMQCALAISWLPQMKVYHEDPGSLEMSWTHKYRHGSGRKHVWDRAPAIQAALTRYFINPAGAGIDIDYVVPAHIAFLIGFRDSTGDGHLRNEWWPALYSSLLDHFPGAESHYNAVETSLAPIKVA